MRRRAGLEVIVYATIVVRIKFKYGIIENVINEIIVEHRNLFLGASRGYK